MIFKREWQEHRGAIIWLCVAVGFFSTGSVVLMFQGSGTVPVFSYIPYITAIVILAVLYLAESHRLFKVMKIEDEEESLRTFVERVYNKTFLYITTKHNGLPNIMSPIYLSRYFIGRAIYSNLSHFTGKLLDVGSGPSPYSFIFRNRISNHVRIDHERVSHEPDVVCDVSEMPVKDNSIDCILCTQLLEYILEPHQLIDNFSRIIKPGGKVLLSAPFIYPVHHKSLDYFRYTDSCLRKLFQDRAFDIIQCKPLGGFFVTIIQLATHYITYWMFRGAVKILVLPMLLVSNITLNMIALLLDRIEHDNTFTLNYFIVAEKQHKRRPTDET